MDAAVTFLVSEHSGHYNAEKKRWRVRRLQRPLVLHPFKTFFSYSLRVREWESVVVFRKPQRSIYVLKKTVSFVGFMVDLYSTIVYHFSAPFTEDSSDWNVLLEKHFVPEQGCYKELQNYEPEKRRKTNVEG